MMRYICLFVVLVLICMVNPASVSACSGAGNPAFIEDMSQDKDLIVRATVVEVDERGLNAILRVDAYLKGHSSEYLTLMRQPAALEIVARVRGYNMACLGNGDTPPWSTPLQAGLTGYFGLHSNGNGTYSDTAAYGSARVDVALFAGISSNVAAATVFLIKDGQVKFHHLVDNTPTEFVLDTAAFEVRLREYGTHDPVAPDTTNSDYPLKRFLRITTESGAHYRLNPDRSITRLNGDDDPLAVSADGSHVAFRIDATHIGFQYLSQHKAPTPSASVEPINLIRQNGQALLFSPDSNYAAVWDSYALTLYLFNMTDYGVSMDMQWVGRTSFHALPSAALPNVVWSANSSTIAYQDVSGIWLWNIYMDTEPRLIVPAGEHITLLDISATGRYIRYGLQSVWTLLDNYTGKTFANAIATPDESQLVFIREDSVESGLTRYRFSNCVTPLAETCPIARWFPPVTDWFWYEHGQIALLSCDDGSCYLVSYLWQPGIADIGTTDVELDRLLPLLDAVAYDAHYNQPVMVSGGYLLAFDFYEASNYTEMPERLDTLDLSVLIDSPVVKLEWGQPVFYEENAPATR